jgi:hypothetical protein
VKYFVIVLYVNVELFRPNYGSEMLRLEYEAYSNISVKSGNAGLCGQTWATNTVARIEDVVFYVWSAQRLCNKGQQQLLVSCALQVISGSLWLTMRTLHC